MSTVIEKLKNQWLITISKLNAKKGEINNSYRDHDN